MEDGMIDTINGFWTAENFSSLEDYLLMHAYNYMSCERNNLKNSFNKIDPEDIADRMMRDNAYNFVMKYYR